jgi:ubiquinone biosynthesis UbiH/UbiF/VisC/COQ6 family hydroxylase
MIEQFDVVIVGGGLVGASMAAALADSRLQVALLEGRPPAALPQDASWDARIYAISPGNQRFLRDIGAWQRMDGARVAPVRQMQVRGDRKGSQLLLDAADAAASELASILENRLLLDALWQGLAQQPNLRIVSPCRPTRIEWGDDNALIALDDGRTLACRLVIGADGANSWVRAQAGIEAKPDPYGQKGVVANFACERPHRGIARQWFFDDGILAWLPLPGNRISIVWSTFDAKADALVAFDADALCERVALAGANELGQLTPITPAAAFPLRLLRLPQTVKPRLALVGDAAHNVHPLAGQGVNLGFQDARLLAQMLCDLPLGADAGDYRLLRRYERGRKEDVLLMQLVTDSLQKLFNNSNPLLAGLRNLGLGLTDRIAPVKQLLIRHALG